MPLRIETDRLILRPFTDADADDVTEYQSNEEAVRFVPFETRNKDEVLAAFARQKPKYPLIEKGDYFILGMEEKATGKVIGQVNLSLSEDEPRTAEFGYMTNPAYWRKGFTLEAITALLDHAFGEQKFHRALAIIVDGNDVSVSFAKKLGMRYEGTEVECAFEKGRWISLHRYALLAREWTSRQAVLV